MNLIVGKVRRFQRAYGWRNLFLHEGPFILTFLFSSFRVNVVDDITQMVQHLPLNGRLPVLITASHVSTAYLQFPPTPPKEQVTLCDDWYLSQASKQPLRPTSGGYLMFFSPLKHVEGLKKHCFCQTISLIRVPYKGGVWTCVHSRSQTQDFRVLVAWQKYINCLNVLWQELWELQLGITLSCNTQKQCNVSRERWMIHFTLFQAEVEGDIKTCIFIKSIHSFDWEV